jgi:predicted transcriptional regulator
MVATATIPNYDWSNLSGPLLELQKINQNTYEEVMREWIAFCSDNTGFAMKCAQTLPRTSSPEDLISTQVKLCAQKGHDVLDLAQNLFKIYQDALRKQLDLAEDQLSTAVKTTSGKIKKAAEHD